MARPPKLNDAERAKCVLYAQRNGVPAAAKRFGVSVRSVQLWVQTEPPHQVTVDAVVEQAEVVIAKADVPPLPSAVKPAPVMPAAPRPLLQITVPGELIARYGNKLAGWVERADHDEGARKALDVVGSQYRDLLELVIFARAEGTDIDHAIVDSVNDAITANRETTPPLGDGEETGGRSRSASSDDDPSEDDF